MASVAASPPSPKDQQREALKTRRSALSGDLRQQADAAINQRLSAWLGAHAPQDLGAYLPLSGEVDVRQAVFEWVGQGGQVSLPQVISDQEPLQFLAWAPGEPLLTGPFGTKEPTAEAPPVDPDVLIVPLVGFDLRGFRLGWGGGYYDRTLAQLRRSGEVTAIGVAYDLQEEEALFADPWDQRLDLIITETRMIEVTA